MMRKPQILIAILITVLVMGFSITSPRNFPEAIIEDNPITATDIPATIAETTEENSASVDTGIQATEPATEGITVAPPTPNPFSALYECNMEIEFLTGPLETKTTEFTVLGRDYFTEKGDKFDLGKGTGLLYEEQQYFILHSAYLNRGDRRPMEAEFIRRYLENWANTSPDDIQQQINYLIGSKVNWICDGNIIFSTQITGVARLSYEASNRLWLQPREIEGVIKDREGLESEWIGGIELTNEPTLYLGFCGWGPESLGSQRYTYYRYLISFEIQ